MSEGPDQLFFGFRTAGKLIEVYQGRSAMNPGESSQATAQNSDISRWMKEMPRVGLVILGSLYSVGLLFTDINGWMSRIIFYEESDYFLGGQMCYCGG